MKEALEYLMLFDSKILKDGSLWSFLCPITARILKPMAGLRGLVFYGYSESARFALER